MFTPKPESELLNPLVWMPSQALTTTTGVSVAGSVNVGRGVSVGNGVSDGNGCVSVAMGGIDVSVGKEPGVLVKTISGGVSVKVLVGRRVRVGAGAGVRVLVGVSVNWDIGVNDGILVIVGNSVADGFSINILVGVSVKAGVAPSPVRICAVI